MMYRWMKIATRNMARVAALALLWVVPGGLALAADEQDDGRAPVSMIMNVEGTVEHTKDGSKWKKVRRNKFLFPGDQVRTAADGKGTFLDQGSGMSRQMGPGSVVKITEKGVEIVSGALSAPAAGNGNLVASLDNRFKTGQKYTTVRRGLKIKLATTSHSPRTPYRLAAAWPVLVWDNVIENPVVQQASAITAENYGEFRYRLTVDGNEVLIPAPKGQPVVRHTLQGLAPGEHQYKVELLKGDALASEPIRRESLFVWMSAAEQQQVMDRVAARGGDELLEAISLDNDGVKVGALERYLKFFADNLDEVDMRPQMLEHIRSLKLGELLAREGDLYLKLRQEGL